MNTKYRKSIFIGLGVLVVLVCLWGARKGHNGRLYFLTGKLFGNHQLDSAHKNDPLRPSIKAYNAGQFKQAEAEALKVVEKNSSSKSPAIRKQAVRARYVLAFSAARRKDMKLARDRFKVLEQEAAKLPDKGKQEAPPGQPSPTLEEVGAYQHAVCTAALGDKKAAEAEYMQFMKDYPESTLLNGVTMRLARLHGGNTPPEAEAAWQQARRTADQRARERQKQQSMCGPECLSELLRRQGNQADVKSLSKELYTSERGTTLQAMSVIAKRHGFRPKGLQLTYKGLSKQPLPLITIIAPGHYVIVDHVSIFGVSVWDPYTNGIDKPAAKKYSKKEWLNLWSGIALVLHSD